MVGATITVCLLVAFLVVLAIYYAYLQGYICTAVKKRYASSNKNTQSTTFSLASSSTGQPSLTPTPEHIRLTVSQNSSQLELMSDSEISADEELAVRRGISVRVWYRRLTLCAVFIPYGQSGCCRRMENIEF